LWQSLQSCPSGPRRFRIVRSYFLFCSEWWWPRGVSQRVGFVLPKLRGCLPTVQDLLEHHFGRQSP
jgi:hypothetical protein